MIISFLNKIRGSGLSAVLGRRAAAALILKVAGVGIGFGLQIYLARILGVTIYGDYVYALTWVLLFSAIANMGVNNASVLLIAGYLVEKSWDSLRGFQRRGMQLVSVVSCSMSLLFIAGVVAGQINIRHELFMTFAVAGLLLPALSLIDTVGGFLRGFNKVLIVEAVQLILRPITYALLITLVFASSMGKVPSAAAVMGLHFLAASVTLVVLIVIWQRNIPEPVKRSKPTFHNRYWLTASIPFMALSGTVLLLSQTDTIMIGMFWGAESAGIYSVASKIAAIFSFGVAAIGVVLAPMVAKLYEEGRLPELQRIVTHATRVVFAFSILAGSILFVLGDQIIGLFGISFMPAYFPMAILVFGQIVNSLAGPVGIIMTMTKHQTEAMYVVGANAVLNIILNYLFIPVFGLSGAAMASCITMVLWNIILVFRVKKHLQINVTIFKLPMKERLKF